ncbi:lamin tail domain-containing protein [Ichthyobacterium seriolicida]|uniref:LTD domain-containing protein n=1 Tax=Ichthyobacterium seriolicida TaxID=242600 RepID=A0A1J1ED65_9FLAO|nr:gliding motility-associated C-terminal domain-containing protein [Ichthyobacterium seriolicida]BAV95464.1 hypothetical protein JBKA6_1451 [Ichthyobacterium seriolicida]
MIRILCFLLVFPWQLYSQVIDDFSNKDISTNPRWEGERDKFKVNEHGQLQLNDLSKSKKAYLCTESTLSNHIIWEFYCAYSGNPSSSNNTLIYLISDNQNLTESLNGFCIKIGGESGVKDKISLYKQKGKIKSKLFQSDNGQKILNSKNKLSLRLRITYTDGAWSFFADKEGGENFVSIGTYRGIIDVNPMYFGILVQFSKTKNMHFFFDDISIRQEGNSSTEIEQVKIIGVDSIQISLSDKVKRTSALSNSNYQLSEIGPPASVIYNEKEKNIKLYFSKIMTEGKRYTLHIRNLEGENGNKNPDFIKNNLFYELPVPKLNSIEVLNPKLLKLNFNIPIQEDQVEFKSDLLTFGLRSWSDENRVLELHLSDSSIIPNNMYLLDVTKLFSKRKSNFPVKKAEPHKRQFLIKMPKPHINSLKIMTDSTFVIKFSTPMDPISATNRNNYILTNNTVVNKAIYNRENRTVEILLNKKLSSNISYDIIVKPILAEKFKGFTGLKTRSIKTSLSFRVLDLKILKASFLSPSQLSIVFNMDINKNSVKEQNVLIDKMKVASIHVNKRSITIDALDGNFELNTNYKIKLKGIEANDISGFKIPKLDTVISVIKEIAPPYLQKIELKDQRIVKLFFNCVLSDSSLDISNYTVNKNIGMPKEVIKKGNILSLVFDDNFPNDDFQLTIKELSPALIDGFEIDKTPVQKVVFSNYKPLNGDIIFTEILSNPNKKGSKFLEIYNSTDKHIQIENFYISNSIDKNLKKIAPFLMKPDQYIAITKTVDALNKFYSVEGSYIEMPLPSIPKDNGKVCLLTPEKSIMDSVSYTSKMHFKWLKDRTGISLERIDVNRKSNENNWTSAAVKIGATPAMRNSQQINNETFVKRDFIYFENNVFSPNGDGIDDLLKIEYDIKEQSQARIYVLDDNSFIVKKIVENENLPSRGYVTWNGDTERGDRARQGIYIIFMEFTNHEGVSKRYHKACVLGL